MSPDGTHLPGSNGGVHRGPDLQPRNFMRAVMMKAYAEASHCIEDVDLLLTGSKRHNDWRKRAKILGAAVENASRMVQNILRRGALDEPDAFGPGLRVLELTHTVMQPAKDEQKGYGVGAGPMMTTFHRPGAASAPSSTPPEPERPALTDADGTPYVEAE